MLSLYAAAARVLHYAKRVLSRTENYYLFCKLCSTSTQRRYSTYNKCNVFVKKVEGEGVVKISQMLT